MKQHNLKTWPEYYKRVQSGEKRFEIRINDRDFQPGDILYLDEWDPKYSAYTGNGTTKQVGYVLNKHDGLKEGYVIMSLLPETPEELTECVRKKVIEEVMKIFEEAGGTVSAHYLKGKL